MRSINILLILLTLSSFVFSQEQTDLGTFKAPKYFAQVHDLHISDDAILLNYSPYVPVANLSLIKYGLYRYAPLNTNGELTEKKIPTDQGIITQAYYSGDTINEFVVYFKKGFPKYQYSYVIRKRSCKTMELLGTEKKLTEYQFRELMDYRYANLYHEGNEFVFVEMTEKEGNITFLSNDFEEINKIKINDPLFSALESKQYYFAKVNPDGSILLIFPSWNKEKITPLSDVKNTILHVTPEGEIHSMVTNFSGSNTYPVPHNFGNYEYNAKTGEITWCYITSSNTQPEQNGLGIARWNLNGNLLSNTNTILNFETIFKDEPEIQNWFKSKHVSTEEIWGKYGRYGYISLLRSGDDLYATISNPTVTPELVSALYVSKIDDDGNMQWIKPILTSFQMPNFYSGTPFMKDGKIHILLADFTVNMDRNQHINKFFAKQDAEFTFFDIALNPKDGNELSNDRMDVTLGSDKRLLSISLNEKEFKAFLEIQSGKTINYKEIILK
ncbi:hypothetical protein [Fluviicola sp.]|uniref:hypothetical protein n=1 Tax=Fluviicola sp. TaxID=1917219 RepID=UPI002632E0D3|nr:hypothetical protein [Fluviicola sp.]